MPKITRRCFTGQFAGADKTVIRFFLIQSRLSAMYSFVRHNSQGSQAGVAPVSETKIGGDKYKSYKCLRATQIYLGSC